MLKCLNYLTSKNKNNIKRPNTKLKTGSQK